MAGKISTLILTVDLDCYICSKKIKKTICKLQGREQIQSVAFDEKKNTVTISGLFDPQSLKKKLLCKACKVIKEINIKEEEKKPPGKTETTLPPKSDKEKEKGKAETEKEKVKGKAETEKEKVKGKAETEKEKEKGKAETQKEKEKEKTKETGEKEKEKSKPVQGPPPACPVGPPLPSCCWRPWYEHYYGGYRCGSCGTFFGWPAPPLPPAGVCMGRPPTSTCQFFCEEDPSCTLM